MLGNGKPVALIYITDGDVVREVKMLSCAAENLDDELDRVLR